MMVPTGMNSVVSALGAQHALWCALLDRPLIRWKVVAYVSNKRITTLSTIRSGQLQTTLLLQRLMASAFSSKSKEIGTRCVLTNKILKTRVKMAIIGTNLLASALLSLHARCYVQKIKNFTHYQTVSVAAVKKLRTSSTLSGHLTSTFNSPEMQAWTDSGPRRLKSL